MTKHQLQPDVGPADLAEKWVARILYPVYYTPYNIRSRLDSRSREQEFNQGTHLENRTEIGNPISRPGSYKDNLARPRELDIRDRAGEKSSLELWKRNTYLRNGGRSSLGFG